MSSDACELHYSYNDLLNILEMQGVKLIIVNLNEITV